MDSEWYGNTNIKQRRFMKKILILFLLFTSTICLGQNHWFKVVNTIYNINERVSILILERNDSLFHVVSNIDEQKHPRKRNKNIRVCVLRHRIAPEYPEPRQRARMYSTCWSEQHSPCAVGVSPSARGVSKPKGFENSTQRR